MVVVQGNGAEPEDVQKDQRVCGGSRDDSQNGGLTSSNHATGRTSCINRKEESGIPDAFRQQSNTIGPYANVASDFKLLEQDSVDSTDEAFVPRIQRLFQSEYECMSSPESSSTSSSNRSSNTSSLHSNYSPDSVSLASFAGRYNFGKWEGSKRCSQASTASQESAGRRSWGKTRDSIEFSDGTNKYFVRRNSTEHTYENTSCLTQETLKNWNRRQILNDMDNALPPLPVRQHPSSPANTNQPEVELIVPYKVVDLEELQKSLACEEIDPYCIYDGSMSPDNEDVDVYSPCVETETKPEPTNVVAQDKDIRPALPPKRRSLTHSLSDTACGSGGKQGTKEQPTPWPRQSMLVNDTARSRQSSGQDQRSTDEESSPLDISTAVSDHFARRKSLPVDRIIRSRRNSSSPQKTARPRRNAPPPPPSQFISSSDKSPLARPVSEMYPKPQRPDSSSPKSLKRSNTVSVLRSPFGQIHVQTVNGRPVGSRDCEEGEPGSSSSSLTSSKTGSPGSGQSEKPVQPKEDAPKSCSSKPGVFFAKSKVFKKALISLKIPGTKKQAKKELVINPPAEFTSVNQSRCTADYENRGRKCVSFVDDGERDEKESTPPDSMAVKVDGLRETVEEGDEQFYHNFPISHAIDCPENQLSPKKPPRILPIPGCNDPVHHDGYLEPCTSQRTKDREDEISQNKLPTLGPLPSPPTASPVAEHAPTATAAGQDAKGDGEVRKPATKAKPALPRRPQSLSLKRLSVVQTKEKLKNSAQKPVLTAEAASPKVPQEPAKGNGDINNSALEKTTERSRSCELIDVYDKQDSYITDMHATVLKDILSCWRKLLRKPVISLAGACWEDFEVIERASWPKVSDDQGSVLQPVQLKKTNHNVEKKTGHYSREFMAKIKSKQCNASKSSFDQDYSVCTSVASHENIARVLAYFRGDIRSSVLGAENGIVQVHTTISISDQVATGTCKEFVAELWESHNANPSKTICLLVLQCLKGLDHLHESGFAHGNLTLSNMFLIKRDNDFQLFLGNFGRSQPLPKERRGSGLNNKNNGSPRLGAKVARDRRFPENGAEGIPKPKMVRNDLVASADVISAMLHSGLNDQNGNVVDVSKARTSVMFGFLEKASARLRDGTTTLRQTVGLLQALLWGPFKPDEGVCILSEGRAKRWLERQRGEFIVRLAMDEALSRTMKSEERRRFSIEDFLLCEYLTMSNPESLIRTGKCWFFDS